MLLRSGMGGAAGRPASSSCWESSAKSAAEVAGLEKVSVSVATTLLARASVMASSAAVLVVAPAAASAAAPPPLPPEALEFPVLEVAAGREMSMDTLTEQDCLVVDTACARRSHCCCCC
jgi:hypothetical protein